MTKHIVIREDGVETGWIDTQVPEGEYHGDNGFLEWYVPRVQQDATYLDVTPPEGSDERSSMTEGTHTGEALIEQVLPVIGEEPGVTVEIVERER